jgi:hypothetical protein
MTVEEVSMMMQSIFSEQIRNSQTQSYTPVPPTPTAAAKQVRQSEYMTTSTSQSKLIEVIKFSNNATSNGENLKQLNVPNEV